VVSFKVNDDEARSFALEIWDLLASAGHEPEPNPTGDLAWFQNDERHIGVGIRIVSIEAQPLYAGALQRALQAIGIDPMFQSGAFKADVPEIRIASKP
jgi:hypothetical protein